MKKLLVLLILILIPAYFAVKYWDRKVEDSLLRDLLNEKVEESFENQIKECDYEEYEKGKYKITSCKKVEPNYTGGEK